MSKLIRCPEGKDGAFEIPDSVTTIKDLAFWECDRLVSVILEYGIATIGNTAFSKCSSLKSVQIPDSVTVIGILSSIDVQFRIDRPT